MDSLKTAARRKREHDKQLLMLWRTMRNDPDAAGKIVTKMDPAEAKRIRELWRTLRKAKGKPKRRRK